MIEGTSGKRVQARKQVTDITVAMNQLLHPGLAQHLSFVADSRRSTFTDGAEFEALKKNLPIPRNTVRICFPPLILGIHEIGIQSKGNDHVSKPSE